MLTFKQWFLVEIGGSTDEPEKEVIPITAVPTYGKHLEPIKKKKKTPTAGYELK